MTGDSDEDMGRAKQGRFGSTQRSGIRRDQEVQLPPWNQNVSLQG